MKKLDIIYNKESKNKIEAVSINDEGGEETVTKKIKATLNDMVENKLSNSRTLIEHIINNFSQEEAIICASGFFEHEFKKLIKKTDKKFKKRKSKKRQQSEKVGEALGLLKQLFEKISSSQIIVGAKTKEEFLTKLKERLDAKGITLNYDKFEGLETKEELSSELKNQFLERGMGLDLDVLRFPKRPETETATEENK